MAHDWNRFLDAARRKAAITAFFSDRLAEAHREVKQPSIPPPIPIQAYFEGAVVSSIAAVDQAAQAVNKALCLRLGTDVLVSKAFAHVSKALGEIDTWFQDPIGLDLRRIRTRVVHYSYSKSAGVGCRWNVEEANPSYTGSRELVDYANAAAAYAARLSDLTVVLEEWLEQACRGTETATEQ